MSWRCLCREIRSFLSCRVRFEPSAVSMVRLVSGGPFLKWVAAWQAKLKVFSQGFIQWSASFSVLAIFVCRWLISALMAVF